MLRPYRIFEIQLYFLAFLSNFITVFQQSKIQHNLKTVCHYFLCLVFPPFCNILVLLDLCAVFDTVDHNVLVSRLRHVWSV